MEQLYILSLRKMSIDRKKGETVTVAWSAVVSRATLPNINLCNAASLIDLSSSEEDLKLTPMTEAQIDKWRKDDDARARRE